MQVNHVLDSPNMASIHSVCMLQQLIKIAAISCLGYPVQQTFLKIACKDCLIEYILFFGNVQQFAAY